jgi:hypothetical protein
MIEEPPPFRFEIIKTYPKRGPLQLFRALDRASFTCVRCRQAKESRLVATIRGDASTVVCNACYGYVLSVWQIGAGQEEDAERDRELLKILASAVTDAQVERGRILLLAREAQAHVLSHTSQTLLSTVEAVREGLVNWEPTDLDWSVAALPLCKAVEIEFERLVARPLKRAAEGMDLNADAANRNLGGMIRYCQSPSGTNLMLGAIVNFLKSVSAPDLRSSGITKATRAAAKMWPNSDWLFESDGLAAALDDLRIRFRNRAAHTEILGEAEFEECWEAVVGKEGVLWNLVLATAPRDRRKRISFG